MSHRWLPEVNRQAALRARLGIEDPRVYVWPRHIPYFHCAFGRWVQHSAYLRQIEEASERFLAYIGMPIGELLRTRRWIPVVQEHVLEIHEQAEIEEVLYTTFNLTEVVARRLFRATLEFHVIRDEQPCRVASARITHGYVEVRDPDWESRIVRLDAATVGLLESWCVPELARDPVAVRLVEGRA